MIDAFEEYRLDKTLFLCSRYNTILYLFRFMKHELRHPTFLCPDLDKGNICPACPKEVYYTFYLLINHNNYALYIQGRGKMIVSMDAIFGLPRKKAAGGSVRAPLHGSIYFYDQMTVDECIETSSKQKYKHQKVSILYIIY